jgi:hypothetical protein
VLAVGRFHGPVYLSSAPFPGHWAQASVCHSHCSPNAEALIGDRLHQALQELPPASGSRAATGSSRMSSSGRLAMARVRAS